MALKRSDIWGQELKWLTDHTSLFHWWWRCSRWASLYQSWWHGRVSGASDPSLSWVFVLFLVSHILPFGYWGGFKRGQVLPMNASGQLHKFGHDSDPLNMGGTKVGIFEDTKQIYPMSLLKCGERQPLEPMISKLWVLCQHPNVMLKRQLGCQKTCTPLMMQNFPQAQDSRPMLVWFGPEVLVSLCKDVGHCQAVLMLWWLFRCLPLLAEAVYGSANSLLIWLIATLT